jgi:hypothetical protein
MRCDAQRMTIAVLGATVAALLLAGCGPVGLAGGPAHKPDAAGNAGTGGAGSPASAAIPDPCGLVTEDEATTAVGRPAGPGVPGGGSAQAPQCMYGNGALIVIATNTGKAEYDSNHQAMAPAGTSQDVSGVGDGAFEVSGGPTALVYFYKGPTLVEIMLQGQFTAPAEAAITVARAAATRI